MVLRSQLPKKYPRSHSQQMGNVPRNLRIWPEGECKNHLVASCVVSLHAKVSNGAFSGLHALLMPLCAYQIGERHQTSHLVDKQTTRHGFELLIAQTWMT